MIGKHRLVFVFSSPSLYLRHRHLSSLKTHRRYTVGDQAGSAGGAASSNKELLRCMEDLKDLQARFDAQAVQLQTERQQRLPGS